MAHTDLSTVLLTIGTDEHLVLSGAEIRVKSGPDRGATLALGAGPQRIGTARDCHLVLSDRTVSAHHAEVTATPEGYHLRDLGSKNRIRLGSHSVDGVLLRHGIKFQLGATLLQVKATDTQHSIALSQPGDLGELVARSVPMRALAGELVQYAASDLPVLIEGETGSGKELVARTLHARSRRQGGPFVVADLTGIPKTLVAATLQGHRRGAFTGALEDRPGLLELADGGTVFLDEVGEVPLDVQPMLLRIVETGVVRRVGGQRERRPDVRLVAATNRNLAQEVRAGRFRQDLFYRLAVGRLRVPPLRARRDDLPPLVLRFAAEEGCQISSEVMELLQGHSWPGNVRELRNTIQRLAVMPDQDPLPPQRAAQGQGQLLPLSSARREAVLAFERQYLEQVLQQSGGSIAAAADLAQVSRSFMSRLAARHGMRVSDRERQ